jgi:hypothetical protein
MSSRIPVRTASTRFPVEATSSRLPVDVASSRNNDETHNINDNDNDNSTIRSGDDASCEPHTGTDDGNAMHSNANSNGHGHNITDPNNHGQNISDPNNPGNDGSNPNSHGPSHGVSHAYGEDSTDGIDEERLYSEDATGYSKEADPNVRASHSDPSTDSDTNAESPYGPGSSQGFKVSDRSAGNDEGPSAASHTYGEVLHSGGNGDVTGYYREADPSVRSQGPSSGASSGIHAEQYTFSGESSGDYYAEDTPSVRNEYHTDRDGGYDGGNGYVLNSRKEKALDGMYMRSVSMFIEREHRHLRGRGATRGKHSHGTHTRTHSAPSARNPAITEKGSVIGVDPGTCLDLMGIRRYSAQHNVGMLTKGDGSDGLVQSVDARFSHHNTHHVRGHSAMQSIDARFGSSDTQHDRMQSADSSYSKRDTHRVHGHGHMPHTVDARPGSLGHMPHSVGARPGSYSTQHDHTQSVDARFGYNHNTQYDHMQSVEPRHSNQGRHQLLRGGHARSRSMSCMQEQTGSYVQEDRNVCDPLRAHRVGTLMRSNSADAARQDAARSRSLSLSLNMTSAENLRCARTEYTKALQQKFRNGALFFDVSDKNDMQATLHNPHRRAQTADIHTTLPKASAGYTVRASSAQHGQKLFNRLYGRRSELERSKARVEYCDLEGRKLFMQLPDQKSQS